MNEKYKNMKNKIYLSAGIITMIFCSLILLSSCYKEEKQWETVLYEKGTFDATCSVTVSDTVFSKNGDSVVFTDLSTKVYKRQWVFSGGTPASSNDSVVIVRYLQSSPPDTAFVATLTDTYFDNTTKSIKFYITSKGRVFKSYGIFTESKPWGWAQNVQVNSGYTISIITGESQAFEGDTSYYFKFNGGVTFAMGSIIPIPYAEPCDISAYREGTFNVAIKTTCQGVFLIRLQSNTAAQKALVYMDPIDESYGLKRDGNWHMLSIPMADFLKSNDQLDLTQISEFLVLRSDPLIPVHDGEDWDFYVDNFYLEVEVQQ
jgi:hypothetical protein